MSLYLRRAVFGALALVWARSSGASPFQTTVQTEDSLLLQALAAFAVAVSAAIVLVWLFKRSYAGEWLRPVTQQERRLEKIEALRIGSGLSLSLVRFGENELLIAEHASGVQVLASGTTTIVEKATR